MITLHIKSSAVCVATALCALTAPKTRATVADKVMESGKMAGQRTVIRAEGVSRTELGKPEGVL
jgi:hypothetical protein